MERGHGERVLGVVMWERGRWDRFLTCNMEICIL